MNTKLWNLYKGSERYRKAVETFSIPEGDPYPAYVAQSELMAKLFENGESVENILVGVLSIEANFFKQEFEAPQQMTRDWYEAFIDRWEHHKTKLAEDGTIVLDESGELRYPVTDFRAKNSFIPEISIFLYCYHEFFKPMLCRWNFSYIVKAFEALGIELPEYPQARDYRGYMLWYYDFCEALDQFQSSNGLDDADTCVCLYDFAEMLMEESEDEGLPKPVNVWITGARSDCKELKDGLESGVWQCNENTRRGDIVVLYALAPMSCIHSIWRAGSESSFNPFNYRQNRTRLVERVDVPPITLSEMKEDSKLGTLPMLNNNLQGVNGKRLPAWAYERIREMIKEKGGDLTKVPALYEAHDWNPGEIKHEKDVENNILIPALRKLGYQDGDWTQQLSQKAGHREKAIPDFVFFPHGETHAEVAPLVIEAKLRMNSERERMATYKQARSYAKMLESEILGICDQERLVLFRRNAQKEFDYTKVAFEAHWAAIEGDVEVHDELMQLIGADTIRRKAQ